jgi:hypothetical protein
MIAAVCRWLGVGGIYMTENNKVVPSKVRRALKKYVDEGFVHLDAWGNDTPSQNKIYAKCFQNIRDKYDWVAFFDADEFLMLLEQCVPSLTRLLDVALCLLLHQTYSYPSGSQYLPMCCVGMQEPSSMHAVDVSLNS